MPIKISLTQFITFKSKVSTSARINYLRTQVKGSDYSPAIDYWRPLRTKIKQFAKGEITENQLQSFANSVPENKRKNYVKDTRNFLYFVQGYSPDFFEVKKASWNFGDQLIISATPELGVKNINGKNYLLKNFYTVNKTVSKLIKRNILPSLTLMQFANQDPIKQGAVPAILNLQNGKLITASPSDLLDPIELEVDAQQIIDIWNRI